MACLQGQNVRKTISHDLENIKQLAGTRSRMCTFSKGGGFSGSSEAYQMPRTVMVRTVVVNSFRLEVTPSQVQPRH